MKTIKIMRGIPGSGKSTYANKLVQDNHLDDPYIISADDFFVVNGKYKFDASKLGEAHRSCMEWYLRAVHRNDPYIIVDNTNINLEDVAPYVAVGEAMGYDVEIVQVNTDPEVAAARNLHSVPRSRVIDMHRRLSSIRLPNRWKVTCITPEKQNG